MECGQPITKLSAHHRRYKESKLSSRSGPRPALIKRKINGLLRLHVICVLNWNSSPMRHGIEVRAYCTKNQKQQQQQQNNEKTGVRSGEIPTSLLNCIAFARLRSETGTGPIISARSRYKTKGKFKQNPGACKIDITERTRLMNLALSVVGPQPGPTTLLRCAAQRRLIIMMIIAAASAA